MALTFELDNQLLSNCWDGWPWLKDPNLKLHIKENLCR